MTVTVRLHAGVREAAGQTELIVEGATVTALRHALAAACPAIAARLASCRFALDEQFVDDDAVVGPDTKVDLIPPVSGG